jgi:hypothetical protein
MPGKWATRLRRSLSGADARYQWLRLPAVCSALLEVAEVPEILDPPLTSPRSVVSPEIDPSLQRHDSHRLMRSTDFHFGYVIRIIVLIVGTGARRTGFAGSLSIPYRRTSCLAYTIFSYKSASINLFPRPSGRTCQLEGTHRQSVQQLSQSRRDRHYDEAKGPDRDDWRISTHIAI